MATPQEIFYKIQSILDEEVRDLGTEDYREVLEQIESDIRGRLDCLDEEATLLEG